MEYGGFIDLVKKSTGLDDEDAARGTKAVLETFGQRISREHRKHLMKQLPCELQTSLEKQE